MLQSHNKEDISTFESFWKRLSRPFILPTDDMAEISRKITCVVFGTFWLFCVVGIYFFVVAAGHERGSDTQIALIVSGVGSAGWGLGAALPTLIYVLWTKQAPIGVTTYFLWSSTFLTIITDTVITFFDASTILMCITAMSIQSAVPTSSWQTVVHLFYVIWKTTRDSFNLPGRMVGAYEGVPGEIFAFRFSAFMTLMMVVLLLYVARWEQRKMFNIFENNVIVAHTVATHILSYDTEKVTESLDSASADVVIDEDDGWTEPSRVSKELIQAFRQINENLELFKPLLPEWAIARCKAPAAADDDFGDDEAIDFYETNSDEGEDEDGDQTENINERRIGGRSYGASVDMGIPSAESSQSDYKNQSHTHYPMQHEKRSWELGDDNEENNSANKNNIKTLAPPSPQTAVLKGVFVERVVVCRLNISKLPSFLISAFQLRNRHSKRFLAATSARFNKIVETLLDAAAADSATVHAIYSDFIFLSWNATTRAASADIKAMKFLTALEKTLRRELTKFIPELDHEMKLTKRRGVGRDESVSSGFAGSKGSKNVSGAATMSESAMQELFLMNNDDPVQQQQQQQQQAASLNSNSVPLVSLKESSSHRKTCGDFINQSEGGGGGIVQETKRPSESTNNINLLLEFLNNSDTNDHRLITGAAVNGSCFTQVAGSLKRQQFVLSSFSQQETFEQACAIGDRCQFISVCKTIFQNTQHEFEFRGCGISVPKKYRHVAQREAIATVDVKNTNNNNSNNIDKDFLTQLLQTLQREQIAGGRKSENHHHQQHLIEDNSGDYKEHQVEDNKEAEEEVADGNLCNIAAASDMMHQPESSEATTKSSVVGVPHQTNGTNTLLDIVIAALQQREQQKQQQQQQQHHSSLLRRSSTTTSFAPLYELVAPKQLGGGGGKGGAGGGDEWMYLVGGNTDASIRRENNNVGENNTKNNGVSCSSSAGLSTMTREIVSHLAKGELDQALVLLVKIDTGSKSSRCDMECLQMLKRFLLVVNNVQEAMYEGEE